MTDPLVQQETTPLWGSHSRLARTASSLPWRALLPIVVVGIALRLSVLWAIWSNGGSPLIGDEGNYILSAIPLSEGRGIPDLWLWIRAPGYIFFAAGVLAPSSGSLFALNALQALLAAPLALAMFFLGRHTSPDNPQVARRAGLWAAAITSLNPLFIWTDNLFLSEQLFLLLTALFLLCLLNHGQAVRTARERAWIWLVPAGALGGAALLTRSNLLIFLPLVFFWLLFLHRRSPARAIGSVVLLLAALAVVVLPWSFRNLARYGHLILVDTTGPINLFLDNTDLPIAQAKDQLSAIDNPWDRQNYATDQALAWIGGHRLEFASRTLDRVLTGWAPDPFTDLRYPLRDKIPGTPTFGRDLYALTGSLAYWLLTVLVVAGLLHSGRSDLRLFLLLFFASYFVAIGASHSEFRFRLPVLGIASVFAAYSLARDRAFWPLRDDGGWRFRAVVAVAFALFFTLVCLPALLPGFTQSVRAQVLEARAGSEQDPAARAALFMQAAGVDVVSAWPLREAAQAYMVAGQDGQAITQLSSAIRREPGDWKSRAQLAELLRDTGQATKSRDIANAVPPTFNAAMQEWSWNQGLPTARKVDVGAADIGWVRGFYVGETDAQTPDLTYRWSTGSAAIKVAAGPGSNNVSIRARALPGSNGEPQAVTWRVNGREVGVVQMDGQWRDYTFALPAGSPDQVVVEINAPARRPSDQDDRYLAVAVDSVSTGP